MELEYNQVLSLINQGYTNDQIAKKYKCHRCYIEKFREKNKIQYKDLKPKLDKEKFIQLYNDYSYTIKQIQKLMKLDSNNMYKTIKELNLPPRGFNYKLTKPNAEIPKEKLEELIKQNYTNKEIAGKFNCCENVINKNIKKYKMTNSNNVHKIRKIRLKNYGNEKYVNLEKRRITNSLKTKEEKEKSINKRRQTSLDRYGVTHFNQLPEQRKLSSEKMSKRIKNGFTPQNYYFGNHYTLEKYPDNKYRSMWEVLFQLLNPDCKYEKLKIQYKTTDGKNHTYFVDFIDYENKKIYEIKPNWVYKKGMYNCIEKQKEAIKWCELNNYTYNHLGDEWFLENKDKINLKDFCKDEFDWYRYDYSVISITKKLKTA